MKRLILPTIAVAAMLYAISSLFRTHEPAVKTEPPSPPPVSGFAETVAAIGLIEPATESVAIGSALSGLVEKVCVKPGDAVTAGAPLFILETRQISAQLAVRQAALGSARAQDQVAQAQLADAEDQLGRAQRLGDGRVISTDEWMRRKFAAQTAIARVSEARAAIATAQAQIRETETELERSVVRAPMDAIVLQVKVREGEFAPAGQSATPLVTLGSGRPLHVRVDVDEHEGWRIRPGAGAVAHVRGNPALKSAVRFVRFEPLVVPKRSLSGDSSERVDTRVLQVIYEISDSTLPLFVGQQMDVFIEDQSVQEQTAAR